MRAGKSSEAASRERQPDSGPAELDRTLKRASPLRRRAEGLLLARRRPEQSSPPPSPPRRRRRRRGPCVTGGDGAPATGEDAAGAGGGSNAQAPPSPAWMLSQGTQEKKNQQFIERRSYSLSGYPTPTGVVDFRFRNVACCDRYLPGDVPVGKLTSSDAVLPGLPSAYSR